MNSKKQLTISIVAVMALVLMIVGVSYAAFTFTGMGQRANTITTGVISMSFTESSNIISIDKALPTTDATGKTRLKDGEYFDFTLSSTIKGSTNVNWEIAAEDITSSTVKKIDGKHIKLYLTKLNTDGTEEEVMSPKVYSTNSANNYTGRPAGMMSLAKGTTGDSFSTKYRLRMYVDEAYNPQGDGGDLNFSVKINAYGKVTTEAMPTGGTLRAYMLPSDTEMPSVDFHTTEYKEKITSIVTKNDNTVPTTAIASYDVSEEQNKSVMAYLEDDGTGAGTYKLTIGGKDGIIANESMTNYFYEFTNVKSIDLSNLDTSFTTNVDSMFEKCTNLTEMNISGFNTSQVTSMKYVFNNCKNLVSLNLSNIDISQVTDMSAIVSGCPNLVKLDMSGLDFSNITNTMSLFGSDAASNLKVNVSNATFNGLASNVLSSVISQKISEINLSGANFVNVDMTSRFATTKSVNLSGASFINVDMTRMFAGNSNLSTVNLSNVKTKGVTKMTQMFAQCAIKSLDFSTFDAPDVTDTSAMFAGSTSLTEVKFGNFNTSKVTDMNNMFAGCLGLTKLDLSGFDISKVTNMNQMFAGSPNLTSITVGKKWIIDSSANTKDMFGGCGTDHVTTI